MLRAGERGLSANAYRFRNGTSKSFSDFSQRSHEVAGTLLNRLLGSADLLPIQWSGRLRRHAQSTGLSLLWAVFFIAWEGLASSDGRIRRKAVDFLTKADAGAPLSLRFLLRGFRPRIGCRSGNGSGTN